MIKYKFFVNQDQIWNHSIFALFQYRLIKIFFEYQTQAIFHDDLPHLIAFSFLTSSESVWPIKSLIKSKSKILTQKAINILADLLVIAKELQVDKFISIKTKLNQKGYYRCFSLRYWFLLQMLDKTEL